jgi:hypothetical protein
MKVCQEIHQQEEVEEVHQHQVEVEVVAVVAEEVVPPIIPAALPTLDDLTRLVNDIGIALRQLATQVTLMAV